MVTPESNSGGTIVSTPFAKVGFPDGTPDLDQEPRGVKPNNNGQPNPPIRLTILQRAIWELANLTIYDLTGFEVPFAFAGPKKISRAKEVLSQAIREYRQDDISSEVKDKKIGVNEGILGSVCEISFRYQSRSDLDPQHSHTRSTDIYSCNLGQGIRGRDETLD